MAFTSSNLENDRVRLHTSSRAAAKIDNITRANVQFYAVQPKEKLDERIAELDRAQDMEQLLETNAGIIALTSSVLGLLGKRGFFLLAGTVLGFLAQHAASGWCPPVPLFRALGVRTRAEIDQEKFALKTLRGDFQDIPTADKAINVDQVLQAVNI